MAKITVTTFLSLDGVMQAPGGPTEDPSGGFQHGGWVIPLFDADLGAFMSSVFSRAESFLLGRKTYEIFAAYWPKADTKDDPVGSALNALPKFVVSRTLNEVHWSGSQLLGPDLIEEVNGLRRRPGEEVQVHGSSELAQSLIENDLVDEYNLLVFPVILGGGRRLFSAAAAPRAMSLTRASTTSQGVLINTYRREGEIVTASVGI